MALSNIVEEKFFSSSSPKELHAYYKVHYIFGALQADELTTGIIARVSVQFQSVVERFAPHDAIISIANPTDLKETAVSSACSLHTASASIRSSDGSLRGHGLAEIAEVVGEQQDHSIAGEPNNETDDHYSSGNKSPKTTLPANGIRETILPNEFQSQDQRVLQAITPTEEFNIDKDLPAIPQLSNFDASGSKSNELVYDATPSVERSGINRPSVERPSIERPSIDRASTDRLSAGRASMDRGHLSRSTRSSTLDFYEPYKPKVKLGPRPSVDSGHRQRTSGSYPRPNEPCPVSSLPPGVHMPARKPLSAKAQSQQSNIAVQRSDIPKISPPPPPIQPTPACLSGKSYSSPGHANGHLGHAYTSAAKASTLTPEKQRLMKALQLRKQQLAKQEGIENLRVQSTLPSPACDTTQTQLSGAEDNRSISVDVVINEPTHNTMDPAIDESIPANINVLAASVPPFADHPPTAMAPFLQQRGTGIEVDRDSPPEQTENSPYDSDLTVEATENTSSSSNRHLAHHESNDDHADQHTSSTTDDFDYVLRSLPQEVPSPSATELEELSPGPQRVVLKETQERVHVAPELDLNTSYADRSSSKATAKAQSGRDTARIRLSTAENNGHFPVERSTWRRGLIDPIRIVSSGDDSDDMNFLSDDSFMEELKSATVQEAKPISVSKSPITPLFPRRSSDRRINGISVVSRTVSSPLDGVSAQNGQHLSPELPMHGSMRSVSASPSPEIRSQQSSASMAKNLNVSSGISQRIKALEMFTSRENSPVGPSHSATTSPIGSVSPVKSLRNTPLPTTSPQKPDSVKSSGLKKRVDAPRFSPFQSPEAIISDHKRRLNGTSITAKTDKPRPESISVTARIVRNARNESSQIPVDFFGPTNMDLLQSPLVVEHQAREWAQDHSQGRTVRNDRPSSIHSSSLESRRGSIASGPSISSRKDSRPDAPRSMSDESSNGLASPDEQGEKTKSRRSRLFKRMSSSFSSASRRSIVQALSPTVKEEPIVEHHELVAQVLPNIVDLGDVNVQFPDTLVWSHIRSAQRSSADHFFSFGSEGV